MKLSVFGLFAFIAAFFAGHAAYATELVTVPMPASDGGDLFNQVLTTIKLLGGKEWYAAAASFCVLIVGSMKVPGIREKLWDKLTIKGFKLQVFVAPLVAVIGGIISLKIETGHIQLRPVLAYLSVGLGAIPLYELLDAIKLTGATNKVLVAVVSAIQGVLKRPAAK